jgi:Flp pilus assembly pilin Flp
MMNLLKRLIRNFVHDESAQGAAEYVLLLVVIVALVVLFNKQITAAFSSKLDTLSQSITNFTGSGS